MYFLLNGCQNPDVLRIVYLATKLLDIVTIILPICLIVLILIDLIKMIIAGDDKQSKNVKAIIRRIVFSMLIFFVPTIVSVIMNLVSNSGTTADGSYTLCFENANKTAIASYQIEQDRQDKIKEEELKQKLEAQKSDKEINLNGSNSPGIISSGDKTDTSEGYGGIEGTGNLYSDLANQMIKIANSEASKTKSEYGGYYENGKEAWCSKFVMWVAQQTTVDNTNLYKNIFEKEMKIQNPKSATNSIYTFSASSHLRFNYSNNYGGSYTPKKGDLIYFKWTNDWDKKIYSSMHITPRGHVGIVEYVKNGRVYTIEGNTSDAISKLNYDLNSQSILGYGSWYKN